MTATTAPPRDIVMWHKLHRLVVDIDLPENFRVIIGNDPEADGGKFFLQIACQRPDIVTGEIGEGKGGKAHPSIYSCDSEIVGSIFGLYKSYVEHEARETFKFDGRRIYGPHISVYALWDAAAHVDEDGVHPQADQEQDLLDLISLVSLPDGLRIIVGRDPASEGGKAYLQIATEHGEVSEDDDKAYPSRGASDSKVLDLAFGLYLDHVEQAARATFMFRERAIYNRCVDAYILWNVAPRIDVRDPALTVKGTA